MDVYKKTTKNHSLLGVMLVRSAYGVVSFLKFLLSRERYLDTFGTRGRGRRRRPVIEVYPKGFIPPHLARLRKKGGQKSEVPAERIDQEKS